MKTQKENVERLLSEDEDKEFVLNEGTVTEV